MSGDVGQNEKNTETNKTTTTTTSDNRIVADGGSTALNAAAAVNSTFNITDGGAFDLVKAVGVQAGDNYNNLLISTSAALENIISGANSSQAGILSGIVSAQNFIASTQDTAQSKGTLDNKTIVMIVAAVAGVAAIFAIKRGRA